MSRADDRQAAKLIKAGAVLADVMSQHFDQQPRAICAMALCMLMAQLIVDGQDHETDGIRLGIAVEEILKCMTALREIDPDPPCCSTTIQ